MTLKLDLFLFIIYHGVCHDFFCCYTAVGNCGVGIKTKCIFIYIYKFSIHKVSGFQIFIKIS